MRRKRKEQPELNGRPPTNPALVKAQENFRRGIIAVQERLADNEQSIKPHLAELSDEDRALLVAGVDEVVASCQRCSNRRCKQDRPNHHQGHVG